MLLRRMFSRKNSDPSVIIPIKRSTIDSNKISQYYRKMRRGSQSTSEADPSATFIQLTPLWEHVIRTKSLPANIDENEMFIEFGERLRDPEWQVRQHALKVLVDVVIVMKSRADQYFKPLLRPLVENLGHSAPAIRKGSLDVLKVYMTATKKPEATIGDIITLGLEQKKCFEESDSRVCVGVMLSLPSIIYTSLGTSKHDFIVRACIEALAKKMIQASYQEIALKVLLRIREMIGVREFSAHIAHGAYRDFELLCNVYGLPGTPPDKQADPSIELYRPQMQQNHSANDSKCKIVRTELCWDHKDTETSADDEEATASGKCSKFMGKEPRIITQTTSCRTSAKSDKDRFILETEIKVEDTAMTMRIFETNCNSSGNEAPSEISEDDPAVEYHHNGFIRIITDSEVDESNDVINTKTPESSRATEKRVTFGGEIVKIRTPDSDSVLQSDTDDMQKHLVERKSNDNQIFLIATSNAMKGVKSFATNGNSSQLLSIGRPKTASMTGTHTTDSNKLNDRIARHKSASPTGRPRRFSYSSDEPIVSPKQPHKGIEVLHNLQKRSPTVSPSRIKHNLLFESDVNEAQHSGNADKEHGKLNERANEEKPNKDDTLTEYDMKNGMASSKSWMDLRLVDDICLRNVHSEDWRLRSNAMCTIEEMLKSSDNLLTIQPHLDSLLHTLLTTERHPDVLEDKRRILTNLISRLPLDNLETHTTQIIFGLCRQGGSGSNRVAKALMQRLPPTSIVLKLISDDVLKARSSRFRENALQIVLYALMTFPSTYFDIMSCVRKSAEAANDKKKRVRQAALDVLAVLGQITSPKIVLDGVTEIFKHEHDSQRLIAAVKARLSRKQLPTVTSDGGVQYALRILTPPQVNNSYFGADIDWITAGHGSVSPPTPKKRFRMAQQSFNYVPSESIRGTHDIRSSMKDLGPYQTFSSSSEGDYENYNVMTNDDKTNRLTMTKVVPSAQRVHPIGYGTYRRINIHSQSFPDLTGKSDINLDRTLKPKSDSFRVTNRISRLPVASRFPSMEANIEARPGRNAAEPVMRYNDSTQDSAHINIDQFHQNYHNHSPDDLNNQKINDELRPATYPEESKIPQPKRFQNVRKYLDTPSSESNTPDKMENDVRYFDRFKSALTDAEANIDRIDHHIYITKSDQNQPEVVSNSENQSYEAYEEKIHNDSSSNGMQRSNDDAFSIENTTMRRPESQISIATTKSLKTIIDEVDYSEPTKTRPSHDPSSIEEIITAKSEATSMENIDNLSAVDDETFDTSLEHIQNESNEKILAIDTTSIDKPVVIVDEYEDNDDIGTEKTEDTIIEKQPNETLLESPFVGVNKVDVGADDIYAISDSESRNSSSRDDSSDFPLIHASPCVKPNTAPAMQKFRTIKPTVHGRFLKRNKISPAKTCPSSATSSAIRSRDVYPSSARQADKPRDLASNCLHQLDVANEWTVVMNGLQSFVQLIRLHPEVVEVNIHSYCVALAKQVKNLRSQVSRLACQASAEFFRTHSKHLELESEDLALQLFNRTADTNKFLRADAFKALSSMCDNLTAFKAIQITLARGATHQNTVVRTGAANLCSRIVSRFGCDKVFAMNREYRDKLILAGANFMMEGSLDTRNNAKALFKQLSAHPLYHRTLLEVIPPQIYRNIEKTLRSIK